MANSHEGMNTQQRAAVTVGDGPVLVLAGPGSGKTRVITSRIAYLIRQRRVPPHRIMAVTFTNKAAGEMRERVVRLLEGNPSGLHIGTFHAVCKRFLENDAELLGLPPDWTICGSSRQYWMIYHIVKGMGNNRDTFTPSDVQKAISRAKNNIILPADYDANDDFGKIVKHVYSAYERELLDVNQLDLDDLLLRLYLLLQEHTAVRERYQEEIEYVLVDEFQDTNLVQFQLLKQIAAPQNNLFVVGDEDQSLYAFRGADYRNLRRLRKDFPELTQILLEQNYRSSQNILDAARAVIENNPLRTPKDLRTENGFGSRIQVYEATSEKDEVEYVVKNIRQLCKLESYNYRDFAVMFRTNLQVWPLAQEMHRASIPYERVTNLNYYERREIKDFMAYLRLIADPDDEISFERIVNVPARGIGEAAKNQFMTWVEREGIGIGKALARLYHDVQAPSLPNAKKKLTSFATMIYEWRRLAEKGNLVELFDAIAATTKYHDHLRKKCKYSAEFAERKDSLHQLRGMLQDATEEGDSLWDLTAEPWTAIQEVRHNQYENQESVKLITLHAAKGTEYPVVFIIGVEQDLLPHHRSYEVPGGIEEERRIFYVGLTRAMQRLYLSYANQRGLNGEKTSPSEFLAELPDHLLDVL